MRLQAKLQCCLLQFLKHMAITTLTSLLIRCITSLKISSGQPAPHVMQGLYNLLSPGRGSIPLLLQLFFVSAWMTPAVVLQFACGSIHPSILAHCRNVVYHACRHDNGESSPQRCFNTVLSIDEDDATVLYDSCGEEAYDGGDFQPPAASAHGPFSAAIVPRGRLTERLTVFVHLVGSDLLLKLTSC